MPDAFFTLFAEKMAVLGLPAPTSLFATFATANGTLAAIAGVIAKFGTKMTLREVFGTIPSLASGGAKLAGGLADANVAIAGMSAAYYLGATTGCLLSAADEVYGPGAIKHLADDLIQLVGSTGAIDQRVLNSLETADPQKRAVRLLSNARLSNLPGRSISRGLNGPRRWGR
jgi:hypothetical protein